MMPAKVVPSRGEDFPAAAVPTAAAGVRPALRRTRVRYPAMIVDRKPFFDSVRDHPFSGHLTPTQVEGMTRILDEWDLRRWKDARWLAYMLATTFHETARAMVPVRELGGETYLRSKPYFPWIGEGLVQVTWEVNAKKFGAEKPGDCMTWPVALRALYDGMNDGMFTGRALKTFFNGTVDDPTDARTIINGHDRAHLVASYHHAFLHALTPAAAAAADKPVSTV